MFIVGSILLLALGIDGLWLAVPVAELLGGALAVFFLLSLRRRFACTIWAGGARPSLGTPVGNRA